MNRIGWSQTDDTPYAIVVCVEVRIVCTVSVTSEATANISELLTR